MAYGTTLVDNIQSSTAGTAPQFKDGNGTQVGTLCRAWVNFNGTGTVAIRASFNVSSITDNGTGDYSINFSNSMPDANYSVGYALSRGNPGDPNVAMNIASQAAGSIRIITGYPSSAARDDFAINCLSIFR